MSAGWQTIESDPGVFTQMIKEIGVKNVQVEELYCLEDDTFQELRPLYGLIFLFKWRGDSTIRRTHVDPSEHKNVFFAQQVINNACATQAILSILLNTDKIDIGDTLEEFKAFTKDFPPEMKGLAISNSERIRMVHNSFGRQELQVVESTRQATADDDVFHFISYVPINGTVYELDGLKEGPVPIGPCTDENWVKVACPEIQARLSTYSANEIHFNLMAVTHDRRPLLREALRRQGVHLPPEPTDPASTAMETEGTDASPPMKRKREQGEELTPEGSEQEEKNAGEGEGEGEGEIAKEGGDEPWFLDPECERLVGEMQQLSEEALRRKLDLENDKCLRWQKEIIRRRHNYLPFIVDLLKILAEKEMLLPLVKKARKKR